MKSLIALLITTAKNSANGVTSAIIDICLNFSLHSKGLTSKEVNEKIK